MVDGPGGKRLLITTSPITAHDGSTLLPELVSDVTEQEAMRARLLHSERLATVGEMASRVAHEIRNPLGIIGVHTDLARRELGANGSAREAAEHLGIVKDEVRRIAGLVESYLRFGRLPEPQPAMIELEPLLDAILATFASELASRKIVLMRGQAAGLPALPADAEQLGQVFVNLVRNAMDAMPVGGTLSVVTSRVDEIVAVEVADTGPGVPPDDAERIFRPFHTTKPTGSGLGLAIAREIVQAHRGSLACRTQAGGGCFVVMLPAGTPTS